MPLDRRKGLQAAERLLRQGKLKDALSELQRVSESAPNDMLTLNRLGDLLARQGRSEEAIGYYRQIADQFADGGFLPKAIAIHKKILRLDAHRLDSVVELGKLYLKQNLHGEARNYLLHAANQHLEGQRFGEARQIYEELVAAEPNDPRHRARLAEARSAEGDGSGAIDDLMQLAERLVSEGKLGDAETIYRRCLEIEPATGEAVLGVANCMAEQGRAEESLRTLEEALRGPCATPALLGEVALRYEEAGRGDDALALLEQASILEVPHVTVQRIFATFLAKGSVESLWARLDPVFERQAPAADPEPLAALLEQLAELEENGHIPALMRLVNIQKSRGDVQGHVRGLEWLAQAYQGRSMRAEAAATLEELRALAPESAMVDEGTASPAAHAAEIAAPAPAPAATVDVDADTPAVPLTKSDEEFVAGRLTQAEVLEKYGLRQQAMEQLREVTTRFQGHVDAFDRLVAMLRPIGDQAQLGSTLAQLALARRAAGDPAGAREAANEAVSYGVLQPSLQQALERFQLLDAPSVPTTDPPAAAPIETEGVEDEIDLALDFGPRTDEAQPAAPVPGERVAAERSAPRRATRAPSADMVQEIRFLVEQAAWSEAEKKIAALNALGYACSELETMAEQISAATSASVAVASPVELSEDRAATEPSGSIGSMEIVIDADDMPALTEESLADTVEPQPVAQAAAPPAAEAMAEEESFFGESLMDDAEDDDLSAITEALEGELFEAEVEPLIPAESQEQSLDDIFSTFKEHVSQEVASDDHRTHYDLGIAYKEMGLTREAIGEFEIALNSSDLFRDACSMIGICYRELSDIDEAVRWYRQAIDAPGGEPDALKGLQYDLADVLLQSGNVQGALALFRDVEHIDPAYRDVGGRIAELQGDLQA